MSDEFLLNKEALINLPLPKVVIFDWDNTLVDTWPLIQFAINATMSSMGKEEWGIEKVKDRVHKSMRESFPEIFGDDWQKAGEIYKNSYRSINLNRMEFLPEALELLKLLKEKNILQVVVSNKIGTTLRREAKSLGVAELFFSLIGSGDAANDKPSSDPVWLALLGSDLDPKKDEIWFVGDTIADLDCAYNSQCRPILFGASKSIPTDWIKNGKKAEGPVPVFFNHCELIEVVKRFYTKPQIF